MLAGTLFSILPGALIRRWATEGQYSFDAGHISRVAAEHEPRTAHDGVRVLGVHVVSAGAFGSHICTPSGEHALRAGWERSGRQCAGEQPRPERFRFLTNLEREQ